MKINKALIILCAWLYIASHIGTESPHLFSCWAKSSAPEMAGAAAALDDIMARTKICTRFATHKGFFQVGGQDCTSYFPDCNTFPWINQSDPMKCLHHDSLLINERPCSFWIAHNILQAVALRCLIFITFKRKNSWETTSCWVKFQWQKSWHKHQDIKGWNVQQQHLNT